MKEIKRCPICKSEPFLSSKKNYVTCPNEQCNIDTWFTIEAWNNRPIEDKLRSENERAIALIKKAVLMLENFPNEESWGEFHIKAKSLLKETDNAD